MTPLNTRSAHQLSKLILLSPLFLTPLMTSAAPLEIEVVVDVPKQQNQVAFVPFAGDTFMSSIILNNLSSTELKITSSDLPQQPHSTSDLSGTLPVWQSIGIPYLVVGSTNTNRGKTATNYEVVDVAPGKVLEGKQTISVDNSEKSLRRAANRISDKIYKLITGKPGDFS